MKSSRKKVLRYSYYRNFLCQLLFGTYKISCISDKKYNASVVIAIRRWSRTYYLVAIPNRANRGSNYFLTLKKTILP